MSDQQQGYLFTHEDIDYKLRKVSCRYECWKNGVFKFGFADKLSFHNFLYESLLRDCFGTKGYGNVEEFLGVHLKSIEEFIKFLDLYGEDLR